MFLQTSETSYAGIATKTYAGLTITLPEVGYTLGDREAAASLTSWLNKIKEKILLLLLIHAWSFKQLVNHFQGKLVKLSGAYVTIYKEETDTKSEKVSDVNM